MDRFHLDGRLFPFFRYKNELEAKASDAARQAAELQAGFDARLLNERRKQQMMQVELDRRQQQNVRLADKEKHLEEQLAKRTFAILFQFAY